jgi:predicted transcriptional regulator
MKALSIKLPDPLFERLAERASARAVSQSEIVRAALVAYLANNKEQPQSAAAQAKRWAGLGEGAADLSTNPGHLKGFGQR